MVSPPSPGTFIHVAHVGVNHRGEIEASDGIEPGWTMMLEELQGYGVPKHIVEPKRDYVEGFVAGVKASKQNLPAATEVKLQSEYGDNRCFC
jgi:neural Wiskott-Aldrich syndrome protein